MIIETGEINLPNSVEDRKKIEEVLTAVVNSMARAKGERTYQNEALKALGKEFSIKPKHLRKLAKMQFDQSFDEVVKETDELAGAYEVIFRK